MPTELELNEQLEGVLRTLAAMPKLTGSHYWNGYEDGFEDCLAEVASAFRIPWEDDEVEV